MSEELTGDALHDWFVERICSCENFQYPKAWPGYGSEAPKCRHCDKWHPTYLMICGRGKHEFYNWFLHPLHGFHVVSLPLIPERKTGWWCWNCLERFRPPKGGEYYVSRRNLKVPPHPSVLPPGYDLYVRPQVEHRRGPA